MQRHNNHHHVPGLLQTSAIMAFQPCLSSVLLMSSLSGDSFLVTYLFRLSVYFDRCLPLLLVPQIFPLNICFSSPSALFICPQNCSCLFLMAKTFNNKSSFCQFLGFSKNDVFIVNLNTDCYSKHACKF